MRVGRCSSDRRGARAVMVRNWFSGLELSRHQFGYMARMHFAHAFDRMCWYETHRVDELTRALEQLARRNDAGR